MFFLAIPGPLAPEDPRRGKAHFEREILLIIICIAVYGFMLLIVIMTFNIYMMLVMQRCQVLVISEINILFYKVYLQLICLKYIILSHWHS